MLNHSDPALAGTMCISIVIPVFNEEDSLAPLYEYLTATLATLSVPVQIVFVDDGSKDHSFERMAGLAESDPCVTVVRLRRNFGQTAAIAAGIDQSCGDPVVLMDADLQNDPSDIPMLLRKIEDGYDVVSGWRQHRQDAWLLRRVPSQVANALISWATGVHLHDYGCTLKAYRRDVLNEFHLYGEMHRFIPALAAQVGARIAEVPVKHHPRRFGKSKVGIWRTFKVLLDLMTVKFLSSYATKPIYLFGGSGLLFVAVSLILLTYILARKLLFAESLIESPFLLMSVMLFILGFQSVLMGLTAELLVRTYHESQNKPTYSVREIINGRGVD